MSLKILLNNTVWTIVNHVLSRGILMLAGVLLARYLLPQDFALYNYFQITTTMLATYSALGLGVSASRYFAELSIDTTNKETLGIIKNLIGIALIVSIAVSLLILMIPNSLISMDFDIPNSILAIAVLILSLNIIPSGAILGLEKYKQAALISFINGLVFLLGVFLSVKFKNVYYSVNFFIIASLLQLLGYLYIIRHYLSKLHLGKIFTFNKNYLSIALKFVGPLVFVSMITGSSGWIIGRDLIKSYGEHVFSAYSIGLQWFALALFIPGMISRVILPRLIKNDSDNVSMLRIACLISFSIALLIFIIGTTFSTMIVSLYGDNYNEYGYVIIGYLFVALIYSPANTLGNAILLKSGSLTWLKIILLWFLILMLIYKLLLSNYQIMAVIYAQVIATSFLLLASYNTCRKKGLI